MSVDQAGVDTWSPSWYCRDGDRAHRALEALCVRRGPGGSKLMADKIDGYRVGWFPHSYLVFAEGHGAHAGLGVPDDLPARLCSIEESLWDFGVPVAPACTSKPWRPGMEHRGSGQLDRLPGFAGVRRLDSTVDLRFDTSAEGLAALAGVAALPMPRLKTDTWRAGSGHLETVAFHGHAGGKVVARWYDKGVESRSEHRGRLIRPEDQRRWPSATRRPVEELSSEYVRQQFQSRFVPLWRASKGVTVSGTKGLVERLAQLVEDGDVSARQAERLMGFAMFSGAGHELLPESTDRRRRAELRDSGLVLNDGSLEDVEVDLHEVLEQALDSEPWGAG